MHQHPANVFIFQYVVSSNATPLLNGLWGAGYIVSEMIDWLKVRDPALMKEIFWNPDNWEAPNSGSSTLGSADCVDGRCTQEN